MGIRAGRVRLGRVATDLSVATHVILDFKPQEYNLRWSLDRLFYFGDGMANHHTKSYSEEESVDKINSKHCENLDCSCHLKLVTF